MSFWSDVLRGLQQAALLSDKVERGLTVAEEARRHSIENRERIVQIETALGFIVRERDAQRRLPPE